MKKNLGGALIGGHIVECFDNMLYGFFAVTLAPLFFPHSNPAVAEISSFGAFAAGYIARPLGALIFGPIGDSRGRRAPLLYTMVLAGIPTCLIGCLPTYDVIGFWAPVLLVALRLMQGIFYGAEFPAVNIYIYETFSKDVLGKNTGILTSSGVLGAVLAAVIGAFVTMQVMPTWAWRIPFFVGGLAAFYITFLRRTIIETEAYQASAQENKGCRHPWIQIFAEHKISCLLAIIISGLTVAPLYLTTFFANQLFKQMGYTTAESMLLNMSTMVLNGVVVLYAGRIADKLGFYRQILLSCTLVFAVAVPAFGLIQYAPSSVSLMVFIISLTVAGAVINGCAMPYVSQLFPTSCRYSAVAATWTIGMALIGGNTPFVARYLIDICHSAVAPAYWLMAISGLTFGLVFYRNRAYVSQSA